MAYDVMTNAEMQAEINAGRRVLYNGKILRTLAELPSDGQILIDYPLYAYNRIEGNAKGIVGYGIYGTPANGNTLVFDDTNDRFNFAAGGGGGSGTVNTGASGALAYYPGAGTTVDDIAGTSVSGNFITLGSKTLQIGTGDNFGLDIPDYGINFDDTFVGTLSNTNNGIPPIQVSRILNPASVTAGAPQAVGVGVYLDTPSTNTTAWHSISQLSGAVDYSGSGSVLDAYGCTGQVYLGGTGNISRAYGANTYLQNYGTGTMGSMYGFYAYHAPGGGPITTSYAYYANASWKHASVTNSYFAWFDSPGVWRVNGDGIVAHYNPSFTKYTPGATNYERIVTQWNANVAEIGTEASGTGTLRALRLIGASYKLAALTTSGVVSTSGGDGTLGITALGTALQVLRVNSGGTALEFAAASGASPGGSGSEIQYRTGASTFGGISTLTSDGTIITFSPTVTTGTGATSGLNAAANSLTTGDAFTFSSSSLTSGNVLKLVSTSTSAASNTQTVLNVSTGGINSASTQKTYAARLFNTHTGTTSTNIGLEIQATGGTTNTPLNIVNTAGESVFSVDSAGGVRFSDSEASGNNGGTLNVTDGGYATTIGNRTGGTAIALRPTSGASLQNLYLFTAGVLGWGQPSFTSTPGTSIDLWLRRAAAANLGLGNVDANPPVAQILSVQNATGTDIAGANWTFSGSRGTGTGAGGSIIFQTAAAGSTGSSQNALATKFSIGANGEVTHTSSSTTAFQSGPNGSTNPVLQVSNSTASQADGVSITGLAAASGTTFTALSSGSNSFLRFTPKGTGVNKFNSNSNGDIFQAGSNGTYYWNDGGSGPSLVLSANLTRTTPMISFQSRASIGLVVIPGTGALGFGSWTSTFSEGADVAFVRAAAGAIRINDGSASGNLNTTAGNLILGTSAGAIGSSGKGVLGFTLSTAPTSSPTDTVQIYSGDAAAGKHSAYIRDEAGNRNRLNGLCVRNSAQFDKTSSTTLSDITGLSHDVEAGFVYAFRATLQTTAAATGGVKFAVSGTATATAISYEGTLKSTTAIAAKTRATALDTVVGSSTTTTDGTVEIEGVIQVNTTGTLTIQFAQNSSDGTASSVLANQYFQLISIG